MIAKMANSRDMVIETFRNVLGFRVSDARWNQSEPSFGFNEIFVEVGKLLACKTDADVISKVETMSSAMEDFSKELWDLKNGKGGV